MTPRHNVTITPQQLAALSLCRAADTFAQTAADSTSWLFVILDMHRALYSALVAVMSGTSGIGAYDDKLQAEFIRAWDESRGKDYPREPTPKKRGKNSDEHYVLSFTELLRQAEAGSGKMCAHTTLDRAARRHRPPERFS
jgi:hypothetical protein